MNVDLKSKIFQILKEYYDRDKLYLKEPLVRNIMRKDLNGKFIAPREIRKYVRDLPDIPCQDIDGNETTCTKIPQVVYVYITGRY
jgi:hypothetical protein